MKILKLGNHGLACWTKDKLVDLYRDTTNTKTQ